MVAEILGGMKMEKVSLCPACASSTLQPFFHLENVPAHQNLVMPSREAAWQCERGDIRLSLCPACGFISNVAFEPDRLKYSAQYDNSQSYSPLFLAYMESLARDLINRYSLYNKEIIEIGCGKGEFLTMLCQTGHNRGIGFDPSYEANGTASDQVTFIQDFYSERYANYQADLICCRHVIEHIQYPAQLVANLRQSIGDRSGSVIFFEMPNVLWILRNLTFWDIFYEHCSYFSPASLRHLFTENGFRVVRVTEAFNGQYLWLEACPEGGIKGAGVTTGQGPQEIAGAVADFVRDYPGKMDGLRQQLLERRGRRTVIWGAGAKGVTILNTLAIPLEAIEFVVDINPRKWDKYIPGMGQRIVPPAFLKSYLPDKIFVVNPNYLPEIKNMVAEMGFSTQLIPL